MKPTRVLLLDPIPETSLEILKTAGFEITCSYSEKSESELLKIISEFHVVCLKDYVYLTDEVIKSCHRVLCIGVFGKSLHSVDVVFAQNMGIPVFSSPFQHQGSVAEITISLIILLSRQIGDRSKEIHLGEWNKISNGCKEVREKTLGIIGYGQVGSQLGVMAEALIALMPIGRASSKNSLEAVLQESDFVALNITSLEENEKIIGEKELSSMKKGSFIINASFGDAIDLDALAAVIKSGHLAGAALDAFPASLLSNGFFKSPLNGLPNVIMTPNIGDITIEAEQRVAVEVANALVSNIKLGSTVGASNFPSIAAWPMKSGVRRIVNIHRNVRGVLQEIDYILSSYNVGKQVLDTRDSLGYIIADIATEEVTTEIVSQLALLAHTVRSRIL